MSLNKQDNTASLAIGQRAVLKGFNDLEISSIMMSMGLVPGTELRCEGKSPFGRTYRISYRDRSIALRSETLSKMILESI